MAADFDAVVVGSGAGGGVVAYVLAARGFKVALVEKGRNPYPTLGHAVLRGSLFSNDELKQRRYYAYHDPHIEPRTFRIGGATGYTTGDIQGLGVCVGGGTVQYDGNSPRLQRADFRLRSTFGEVDGADVVDWPIGYEDVEPFFEETEKLIGVQGLAGADPFAEPRNPYPMPPGYKNFGDQKLARAARDLGYHPHPMPTAIDSIAYRGRPACANCGFCVVGCPINAKGSTAVTVVRDALRTGNCTLMPECCVIRVDTEPSGERASGVTYIDGQGQTQSLTARHVVLAGNAIETPRLMLMSASNAHPDGLGNGSDRVGRYLMFHVVFATIGVFREQIRSYRGRIITQAMADFTVHDGSDDFVRGGYVEMGGQIQPVEYGANLPWLLHHELMIPSLHRKHIVAVSMMGEDVPVFTNRVELDPEVKDVYGQPVARITYAYHAHDMAMLNRYTSKMEEIALAAGATSTMKLDMASHYGAPDTKHLLGTTRMGADPATSVCDPWGRLHEVDNVWVADGGLWPTSAAFNPTLAQQALAYRTAAYIANPEDVRP